MDQYRVNGITNKIIGSSHGVYPAILEAARIAVIHEAGRTTSYHLAQRDMLIHLVLTLALDGEEKTPHNANRVAELLLDYAEENPRV